ncbi:FkbM family methyltransferase [Engelhardtia mirabilis]|uniref:Methyltransferase FkbM domain-containing protein n=1 Tax=Engelhardtia mirabilis TaxID=2528011 RepID=A0A518BIH5_9BACT|nr:hypothetical protein Pla133_18420 [Planctomycetes bacterium Pla133]QDV01092.1 hypothetical protein Pla86_18410 [Planctomycetes bacterium Pla86]
MQQTARTLFELLNDAAPGLVGPMRRLYSHTVTRRRVIRESPREVEIETSGRAVKLRADTWETANFVLHNSTDGRLDYEPEETSLFRSQLPGVDTFFDVGGHIGYYGLLAAADNPGRRVVAFEILEDFADEIERHAKNNRLDNVTVERAAIGSGGEAVSFTNFADSNSRAAVSLDDYCQAKGLAPKLIKMDIEGHEVAGISGMAGLLSKVRPVIQLAFHPPMILSRGHAPVEALRPLWKAGYETLRVGPGEDGRGHGLEPITAANVPADLCTLLCRPI